MTYYQELEQRVQAAKTPQELCIALNRLQFADPARATEQWNALPRAKQVGISYNDCMQPGAEWHATGAK